MGGTQREETGGERLSTGLSGGDTGQDSAPLVAGANKAMKCIISLSFMCVAMLLSPVCSSSVFTEKSSMKTSLIGQSGG